MTSWPSWRAAWVDALYGPGGFYLRPEGPAGHFRTAAHAAGAELAAGLLRLAADHGCTAIVDVGAGRGELLTFLSQLEPELTLHGVDVVERPAGLPARIGWSSAIAHTPAAAWDGALVIGWELLDVVPCRIYELDDAAVLREVLVEPSTGRERLGAGADSADQAWCRDWWPPARLEVGDRVECGRDRDAFWAGLVQQAAAGSARALLAVDYGHRRETRPRAGSLTGFRTGRAIPPRPDGSMDVTAHVAMDSVAAAGIMTGASTAELTTQAAALTRLGVGSAELLDPGGLGGFDWLLQTLAPPHPELSFHDV